MERIGVRELRGQLAAVLRRAEGGERFVITIGGRPVARLVSMREPGTTPTLDQLAAQGRLIAPRRRDRPNAGAPTPLWAGARVDRLLTEVRGR